MISKHPSIWQYKAAQVFTDGSGFDHFYDSMKEYLTDSDAHMHSKIGDHLEEIDPILADQEPIPDFLFEDEVLDKLEEPQTTAEHANGQGTPEAYDQWLARTRRTGRNSNRHWSQMGSRRRIRHTRAWPHIASAAPIDHMLSQQCPLTTHCLSSAH
jgi:hypothetical protein